MIAVELICLTLLLVLIVLLGIIYIDLSGLIQREKDKYPQYEDISATYLHPSGEIDFTGEPVEEFIVRAKINFMREFVEHLIEEVVEEKSHGKKITFKIKVIK